ncbi:MAG: Ig-like domain-containing protein, partial [Clostridia bacterium]|nr:Ig-like domain-containing protein [Clostridia bacterium]
ALVIHMDEEAGNEYMAGEVDFDLRVLATQEAYEADSFGTDYDANAEYPPAPLLINTTTSGNHDSAAQEAIVIEDVSAISTIPAETTVTTATITGGSASTGKLSRAIATTPGDNSVTYDISYSYTTTTTSGTETTSTTEAVTAFSNIVVNNLNIGPNLANVTVTHSHTGSNPVPMTALASADTDAEGYYYDYVTGVLTIKSMTYSDFIVSYTKKIDVSSVTISGDATVETGSTLALAATVLPANASYKDVAWTSSDAAVATVDANGVVTGVAEGSVTITATADGHSATFDVSVFPAGCVYISDVTSLQLASRKSLNDPKDDVYIVLTGDIIFDSPDDFVVKTDNRYCNLIVMNRDVTINLNGHNIRATENAFIPERENAGDVPKMILIYKASLTIIGEGNVVTENQGIAVDSFQDSTVNIYGGNYVSNSHIRTESAVYVNKGTASINVYGGTFMDSNYAFNVHDDYGGKIVIHEGVSFKEFSEANSTQLIASDISHNRIKAADGCYFKTSEIGGQTVYEVALIGE